MPRIWIDYCQFLVDQCKVTRSRHTFDRALRALPITQHRRIWPIYLKFVRKYHIPETAVRVYRRYLKVGVDILYYLCTEFCLWIFLLSVAFNKIASSCLVEDSLICTFQILLISYQLQPENTEDYIDYLKSVGWLDEAATRLAFIVNKVFDVFCYFFSAW